LIDAEDPVSILCQFAQGFCSALNGTKSGGLGALSSRFLGKREESPNGKKCGSDASKPEGLFGRGVRENDGTDEYEDRSNDGDVSPLAPQEEGSKGRQNRKDCGE